MSDLEVNLGTSPVEQHESERETPNLAAMLARKGMEARSKAKPPVDVPNPADEDMGVRFRAVVPVPVIDGFWAKMNEKKIAEANLSILTAQCVCLLAKKGVDKDDNPIWEPYVADDGTMIGFAHEAFTGAYGSGLTRKAIEAFYGGADGMDGALPHIGWVVDEIFKAAGIGVRRDGQGRPLD